MANLQKTFDDPVQLLLTIDPAMQQRLIETAARRQLSVPDFVIVAIEEQILRELNDDVHAGLLSAETDPVLAELWNNPNDEVYDRL